jgi:hypothetical protein
LCAAALAALFYGRQQVGGTAMLGFVRVLNTIAIVLVTAVMLAGATAPSYAQSGTVRLHIIKAGFIIGVGGGNGVLHYQGHVYPFSIGGIGIGSLGIAAVDLVGTATNIHNPYDIAGTYGAAGAGGAFVAGAQAATLQNEKGVVLTVHGVQAGFQISLGLAGMTISMR